jgi:RES domain-containing protein
VSIAYRDKRDRAFNPVYAREPLSGRAAAFFGGGFKPERVPALYSSVRIMTALRQANQVDSLQPTPRVAYEAEIDTFRLPQ